MQWNLLIWSLIILITGSYIVSTRPIHYIGHILPAAVFARGLTGRFASLNAGTAVLGFFLWEMVKMALSLAMLVAAPGLVVGLSWPALLLGLFLTMKVYWVAMAFAPKRSKNVAKHTDE